MTRRAGLRRFLAFKISREEHIMKILSILLLTTGTFAATPAETAIEKAQAEIAKHPDHAPYYNALAMAYARRARETSDVQFYAKAEETLKHSFALAPDNYDGLK